MNEFTFRFYEELETYNIIATNREDAEILAKAQRIKEGKRYYSYEVAWHKIK